MGTSVGTEQLEQSFNKDRDTDHHRGSQSNCRTSSPSKNKIDGSAAELIEKFACMPFRNFDPAPEDGGATDPEWMNGTDLLRWISS
ncbi:hypothetical protein M0R45_033969 [Rubus argutus]|uniref:Uncharacterized protein n=1 Tax=Rubus argutus TaxID=59490 RepID=A0AAW1VP34_RUBAR